MAINKYTLVFQSYGQPQLINLEGCNSVIFFNSGTDIAFIEGCPITPGASLAITGNECEVTFDVLQLTFANAVGTIQQMTIIKKSYTQGFTPLGY